MTYQTASVTRGASVVHLLRTHEALSFGALRALITPPISKTRLRKVVTELVETGVVRRRLNRSFGGTSVFFEVRDSHTTVSDRGSVHHTYLLHNDLCALAGDLLKRSFPGAVCAREHAIPQSPTLRNVMSYEEGARDSLPDILVILPGIAGGTPAYVAVEIERSAKSSKRIFRKLYKYAARTALDGVLYLSEDHRVLAALRRRYMTEIAGRARRVGHYKEHFFVTAACPTKQVLEFRNTRSSINLSISLQSWMQALAAVSLSARRDKSSAWGDGVVPGPLNALT